jgi:hypothetical protein
LAFSMAAFSSASDHVRPSSIAATISREYLRERKSTSRVSV